jgi:hypothetical protein
MNKNQIACELSRIVEDNYNIHAYGIRHCKKEYTEADLYEKVLQLYILQTGHNCDYYMKFTIKHSHITKLVI